MPADADSKYIEEKNQKRDKALLNPSNIETVDYAFYDFINEEMRLKTETNKGWKKPTVIWASPERVYFSKKNKDIFDLDGTLIYPLVSIQRTSTSKDLGRKGKFWGSSGDVSGPFRGGRIVVSEKIVQDKTNNFAIARNRKKYGNVRRTPGRQSYYPLTEKRNDKIVIETLSVPQPVYLTMKYDVTLRTNYQQHMNQLLQPFATLGGHINYFLIRKDGHSYETFMKSDLSQSDNISSFDEEERIFETKISFEVLGYITGEGLNQEEPHIIREENAVEVKIPRERVILADEQDFDPKSGFYRD